MNKRRAESGGGSAMGGLTAAGGGRSKGKSGLTFVDNDFGELKPAAKAKGGCC